jgi:mannose-1-phosphate guanylyltransferase/phosphomannomutase
MKGVILAAGLGTRLRPAWDAGPKAMVPLLGKPLLQWNIEYLRDHGIRDIAVNLHYMPEAITSRFGEGKSLGVRLRYSHEPELLGTSGALAPLAEFLDETFVVCYADVISQIDLAKVIGCHNRMGSDVTLVTQPTQRPEDADVVVTDEGGRVRKLIPAPGTLAWGNESNSALYVLEPCLLEYLPVGKSDFIHDVFPCMIHDGRQIGTYRADAYIEDAGTPERLRRVGAALRAQHGRTSGDDPIQDPATG